MGALRPAGIYSYPPQVTLYKPTLFLSLYINLPYSCLSQIDLAAAGGEARAGEWVPYVQPARDDREQNLEAFLQDGQLHYRATRTIGTGEELLIWYSKDMAATLGVPELMPFHIRGESVQLLERGLLVVWLFLWLFFLMNISTIQVSGCCRLSSKTLQDLSRTVL